MFSRGEPEWSTPRTPLEFAQETLGAAITRPREVSTVNGLKSVASYYGLKPSDIKSERRHKSVATPPGRGHVHLPAPHEGLLPRPGAGVRPDAGHVWCWGNNGFGQLGLGFNADATVPVIVTPW